MVDRWANKIFHPTMEDVAEYLPRQISADTITLVGFVIGMAAVPLLWLKLYSLALVFILLQVVVGIAMEF